MEKVTYNGLVYTIEEKRLRSDELFYKLSGMDYYVKASDCTHWLSGWLNQHFNNAALNRFLITLIALGLTIILFRCII